MIFKPIVEYRCPHCFTTFYSNKIRKFCSRACTAKWSMLNGARDKISKSRMGIQAWNKGITNPTSAKNGQNSAKKQSATVTGRKIAIINGKRTWIYPDKFFIHNLNGLT